MKIIVADDDRMLRRLLEANLTRWGHEVIGAADGAFAWEEMQRPDGEFQESCVRRPRRGGVIPEGTDTDILHAEGVWGVRGMPPRGPGENDEGAPAAGTAGA